MYRQWTGSSGGGACMADADALAYPRPPPRLSPVKARTRTTHRKVGCVFVEIPHPNAVIW